MKFSREDLRANIAAFEKMESGLLAEHPGKIVLLRQGKLAGVFRSKEAARAVAAERYPEGGFAISPPIGMPPATLGAIGSYVLPVSV